MDKCFNRALFLDRDGVINLDVGYLHEEEHTRFNSGIFELVKVANENKYHVSIITNQSGIGRGYYDVNQFWKFMNWMKHQFYKKGCRIDSIYYCPFHVEAVIEKYRKDSFYRKPNPGMILEAMLNWELDLKNSVLIGDKQSDIEAGKAAGVGINLLLDPNCKSQIGSHQVCVSSLSEAERYLVMQKCD